MSDLNHLLDVVSNGVQRAHEEAGPFPKEYNSATLDDWHKAQREAHGRLRKELSKHGAKFADRAGSHFMMSLGGIRSTSTCGWSGVFNNWMVAARKRLGKAA